VADDVTAPAPPPGAIVSASARAADVAVNRYRLCVGSGEFVAALRDALRDCRSTLWVQFSTFEGDTSGEQLAAMLLEHAARGVDVRLMVDCYTDVIVNDIVPFLVHRRRELRGERARTAALLQRLARGGVAVRRTAPAGRFGRYILFRDHRKMVVIDGTTAFVGGLNVSDHNYGWHDFMVRVDGPLVEDVAADFAATWDGRTAPLHRSQDGDFVLNHTPARPSIADEIVRMVESAERSIVVESPSLLGGPLERALAAAAARGVDVTLVAPARHNRWIFRRWVRATHRHLARAGVRTYGYRGTAGMTHAKLLIADDRATFGSYNFFELEALTQRELNVFTGDPALVSALRVLVAGDVGESEPLAVPRSMSGVSSYRLVARLVAAWTRRLLRDPGWTARYG
jgi:cardiolipin synthase